MRKVVTGWTKLSLLVGAVVCAAAPSWNIVANAEEAKAPEAPAAAPDAQAAAPEAPAPPAQEPERITGKLYKVDSANKTFTVIVEPERGRSGRAFKRYKLVLDDKSLILVDQQPSTIAALETGQFVEVGFFKKGKEQVVDTVVVVGKDQN